MRAALVAAVTRLQMELPQGGGEIEYCLAIISMQAGYAAQEIGLRGRGPGGGAQAPPAAVPSGIGRSRTRE